MKMIQTGETHQNRNHLPADPGGAGKRVHPLEDRRLGRELRRWIGIVVHAEILAGSSGSGAILFGTAYGCEVLRGHSSFCGRLDGGWSEEGKRFEGEPARSVKRRWFGA